MFSSLTTSLLHKCQAVPSHRAVTVQRTEGDIDGLDFLLGLSFWNAALSGFGGSCWLILFSCHSSLPTTPPYSSLSSLHCTSPVSNLHILWLSWHQETYKKSWESERKGDREIRGNDRDGLHTLVWRQRDGISDVFQHRSCKQIYFLIYPLYLSFNRILCIIYFNTCISGWE